MGEHGERVIPMSIGNTLELRLHIMSIDSHKIEEFCMTKACRWMGKHGSELLVI